MPKWMMHSLMAWTMAALLAVPAVAHASDEPEASSPEATLYDPALDAGATLDAALARAAERETLVLLVMGANWCHDSRALAGWLETPRFEALLDDAFEPVFVNVGMPQTGDGFNLDIARRFGIDDLPGTPNLFVITPDGALLNADSATGWRDAGTRSEDEIYDELAAFAAPE